MGASLDDHLDVVIGPVERRRWSVWFMLCTLDPRKVLVHIPVNAVPTDPTKAECANTAQLIVDLILHLDIEAGLLVAVTRPGTATVVASDRLWYHAAREACIDGGVPLLGVHLVTPSGQREIMLDDAV
jgi:hypothetical protein